MSHRPSISFNKPTTIPLKPTQLHNCQIRDIYIIQLFKESFWPSFCNGKCGLHARRTSADFLHKYAKENSLILIDCPIFHRQRACLRRIRWVVYIKQLLPLKKQGSAYLKKKTFECLLDADLIFAICLYSSFPGYLSCPKWFQHRLPKLETVRNVQNKRFVKEKNNCFCSQRM